MEKRSKFSNKLGFVMAAAGSAVGLGNIWRFPYLAAKYGGGLFLLIYVFFVLTFGYTIMTSEIALGRKTRQSPIGAYRTLNKKFSFIGVIACIVTFIILPYYSVIGGWVIKYLITYLTGGHAELAADGFFDSYIASPVEPVVYQIIFVVATLVIILRGVTNGIEKASKIMMPLLILLSIAVAIYSITLPGAMEGVKYLFIPNFENFSVQGVLAALGQMFYSLSLAMGIMITFGSYLDRKENIEKSVGNIEFFDSGVAILAGLMVIPAVFAFSGGDQSALGKGAGLMFVTLPKVFEGMGMSTVIGCLFFLLVFFAAITSSISLMEACVSSICDQLGWNRKRSSIVVAIIAILLGLPASLGYGLWSNVTILGFNILDFMDFITNSVLMPVGALLTCIFIGWVVKPKVITDEIEASSKFRRKPIFIAIIKYIGPLLIISILVFSVLEAFQIISV